MDRALAHVEKVVEIRPIEGKDRVEAVRVLGWWVMCRKGQFQIGDKVVYFEIDSLVPAKEEFAFLESSKYKIKTQTYKAGAGYFYSQGLIMSFEDLKIEPCEVGTDLTEQLEVKYYEPTDNARKVKENPNAKYQRMAQKHPEVAKTWWWRKIYRKKWGKKLLFVFFGRDTENPIKFPTHFQYVHKTDVSRIENVPWILEDTTPYIRTTKCDGTSASYILERKKHKKFEFYVCSRNVRMLEEDQECFYNQKGEANVYWDMAKKYNIEAKLKNFLQDHPDLDYVCWQGEICGPGIQKNPHKLSCYHLFCFHMIDSQRGMYDIRDAKKIWDRYNMEAVYIDPTLCHLINDIDYFKLTADGYYDPSVCEGHTDCPREGFVYYKSTDPNFSFKNVSRDYLCSRS